MKGKESEMAPPSVDDDYLTPGQVARILHVSPKTISRWAREGKLGHVVTLGGHRRFSRSDIEALAQRMMMSDEG